MILPSPKDAIHKAWLYRLLISLIDNPKINKSIYFKGGTCASMLGYLDRFSVDLDFDIKDNSLETSLRKEIHEVVIKLGLQVKYENLHAMQFVLKYPVEKIRNTISLDIIDTSIKSNKYESRFLTEIDRYAYCQTVETMFAHKLVAITDRYKKYKTIAGRDIYDIHSFFTRGYTYSEEVIKERTGKKAEDYLKYLQSFIKKHLTQRIIDQDLNLLLPKEKFAAIRKTLVQEVLMLLADDSRRKWG